MDDDLEWKPPTEAEMKLIQARRERSDKISKLMSGYLLKGYKMLGVVCAACDTILLQDRQGTKYCVACSELDSDTDKDNPLTSQSAAQSMVREMELSTSISPNSETKTKVTSQGVSLHTQKQTDSETGRLDIHSSSVKAEPVLNGSSTDTKNWSSYSEFCQKEQKDVASSSELYVKQEHLVDGTCSDSGFPSLSESLASSHLHSRKRHANVTQQTSSAALSSPPLSSVSNLLEKIDWASSELKDTGSVEYSIQLCQLIKVAAEAIVAVKNARV